MYVTGNTIKRDTSCGVKLQVYLDEHGVSYSELERRTGITRKTISSICSGERDGNMATWRAIARALNLKSLDEITTI